MGRDGDRLDQKEQILAVIQNKLAVKGCYSPRAAAFQNLIFAGARL